MGNYDDLSWLHEEPAFEIGDEVMAVDIKALPAINGVIGTVLQLQRDKGRFGVRFPAPYDSKSLKATNLQLVRRSKGDIPETTPKETKQKVTIETDTALLEKLCRADPTLPLWQAAKARHAGQTGVVVAVDNTHRQVRFETGESCWFPEAAVSVVAVPGTIQVDSCGSSSESDTHDTHDAHSTTPSDSPLPKSPAVSAMPVPAHFKCPIKVHCESIGVDLPGGMLRQNSVLSKGRKVVFDEAKNELATFDPYSKQTQEEKDALKQQERAAAAKVQQLEKAQMGAAAVVVDEKEARHEVEKEEHKRRKGLKGSYMNSKVDVEILEQQAQLSAQFEHMSAEDLARLQLAENESSARRELDRLLEVSARESAEREALRLASIAEQQQQQAQAQAAAETAQHEKQTRSKRTTTTPTPPSFISPSDIFSSLGWSYDDKREETVHSPLHARKITIEETSEASSSSPPTPVAPTTQSPQPTLATQDDLEVAAEQIRTLTGMARTLRESNVELKGRVEKMTKEHAVHASDMKTLEERRAVVEERLAAMMSGPSTPTVSAENQDYRKKYEKLNEQMQHGYKAMQNLEDKNEALLKQQLEDMKIKKLFEAHSKKAYDGAVRIAGGSGGDGGGATPAADSAADKRYEMLLAKQKETETALQKALKAQKAALAETAKLRSAAAENVKAEAKQGNGSDAEKLEKALREKAEQQRLITAFQARLKEAQQSKAAPKDAPKVEKELDEAKRQLEHAQEKLRKNKEERERLETSLKREKEKTKQLRAVVTAAQGATSGKKR